jgi:hypothetical protein
LAHIFQSHQPRSGTLDVGIGPYDVQGFIPKNASVEPPVYFPAAEPGQPPDLDRLFEN